MVLEEGARHCSGQRARVGDSFDSGLQFSLGLTALAAGRRFGGKGPKGVGASIGGIAEPLSHSGTQATGLRFKRLEARI